MMSLEEAAQGLDPDPREHVLAAVAILVDHGPGDARRVARNLRTEFRVPQAAWAKVFGELRRVDIRIRDAQTAHNVLVAVRAGLTGSLEPVTTPTGVPSRRPVGPVVDGLEAKAYGRLVTLPTLVNYWKGRILAPSAPRRRGRAKAPAQVIRDLVEELQTPAGVATRAMTRSFGKLPLGFFVLWSTFDGEAFEADPFPPRPAKFGDLAGLLGLDQRLLFDGRKPPRALCVLLGYRLPDTVRPRVPTVVEAYSGTGRLNYYFEVYQHDVSVAKKQFPRTLPIPDVAHLHGVPEIVHEVVFADRLTMPVELAHF